MGQSSSETALRGPVKKAPLLCRLKGALRSKKSKKTGTNVTAHGQITDQFILDHYCTYVKLHGQTDDPNVDIDLRRLVFVSVLGLFNTYRACPPHKLYAALFVLPIKKEWVYNLTNCMKDDKDLDSLSRLSCFEQGSGSLVEDFIRLLKWKDSQCQLFCMLDEYEQVPDTLVHPFWCDFVTRLSAMYNPVRGSNYASVDSTQLMRSDANATEPAPLSYVSNRAELLVELYLLCMKFKSMKEVIERCHPVCFNIVSFYGQQQPSDDGYRVVSAAELAQESADEGKQPADDEEGEWHISDDYDPAELDWLYS